MSIDIQKFDYTKSYTIEKYDDIDAVKNLIPQTFKRAGIEKFGRYEIDEYNNMLQKVTFGERAYAKENFLEEHSVFNRFRQIMLQYDQAVHTLIQNQIKMQKTEVELAKYHIKMEELKNSISSGETTETYDLIQTENKIHEILNDTKLTEEEKNIIGSKLSENSEIISSDNKGSKFKKQKYELEIVSLDLKMKEILSQQSQGAKLIQDAINNKEVLEKKLESLKPFLEKLEKNNINSDDEDAVYYARRFIENSKIKQFLSQPFIVEMRDESGKVIKQMDANRGLDAEIIKAIFKLTPKAEKKALRELYLPENLKQLLSLNYNDSIDNIVENYNEYLEKKE